MKTILAIAAILVMTGAPDIHAQVSAEKKCDTNATACMSKCFSVPPNKHDACQLACEKAADACFGQAVRARIDKPK
jgi:hypothetical protein